MTVDRSIVGVTSEPVVFDVERGAIRKLAQAIGDPDPVVQAGDVAPPTFPTTFRIPIPGLQLDLSRVLHAGEEYVYERPIREGDRLTCVRRIADVFVKEGRSGALTFLVSETEGRDSVGRLVFTARSTVIVR